MSTTEKRLGPRPETQAEFDARFQQQVADLAVAAAEPLVVYAFYDRPVKIIWMTTTTASQTGGRILKTQGVDYDGPPPTADWPPPDKE